MNAEPAEGASGETLSGEAVALSRIFEWSQSAPTWQRDALRRLFEHDEMDGADLIELLAICKGERSAIPLTRAHIRDPGASTAPVSLKSLDDVENVNALSAGQHLTFGPHLTIVYGDNGAGKSGYTRVLKQLCRARSPKGDTILPNVYRAPSGPPKASITFQIGGQRRTFPWTQGAPADPALSAVSVFDTKTANVHVEASTGLAYTPMPLRVLAALAAAAQELKAQFEAEINEIEAKTPAALKAPSCTAGTAVHALVGRLAATTKPSEIQALANLNPDELARLDALQSDLAGNPERASRVLLTQQHKVDNAAAQIEALAAAVTDQAIDALSQLRASYAAACATASAVSTSLFSGEPLPDVGTEVWKRLWEAARAYSQHSAYPDRPFPQVEHARCVLCQQELTPAAADRLASFEAFVRDESEAREREAKRALDTAEAKIAAAALSSSQLLATVRLLRDEAGEPQLAREVRAEMLRLKLRCRAALRGVPTPMPAFPASTTSSLRSAAVAINQRAVALATEANSPERRALAAELAGLKDRQWLAMLEADVLSHIDRLKAVAELRRVMKDTSTNKITTLSGTLASELVTNRLRDQFHLETNRLGVAGVRVELHQVKTSAGIPFFQIRLLSSPGQPVERVLSEGEHRCVALAAFLAELATLDAQSAIVFDDPVCSLDHERRDKVAARLADEAAARQVIVFTHDTSFLLLLTEACRATSNRPAVPITYRCISRGPDHAGFCHEETPANVAPLDQLVDKLRNLLRNTRQLHASGHPDWDMKVRSFELQLRTAWERAVEEVVGPVVRRLSRKVDTKNLIKLTVLTDADCQAMREAYGRCSELLHSQPGELNSRPPGPAVIEAEIEALASWIADIRGRQERAAAA